eukprot:TRINITY_DN25270_c0_g1_i6.p1 TRINITY_DN25270_c0_g1~~TRINITY_DN25270_c0_g1_i6.p1  ORF type:complete len:233 (-),score=35.92 TRINITY_DN25270_c0_g1_i6:746-1444(-)
MFKPLVYLTGGMNGNRRIADFGRTMTCYDPYTEGWSEMRPMLVPRYGHVSAVLAGRICVAGGCDHTGASLTSAEAFDPHAGRWEELPPMSQARHLASCAVSAEASLGTAGGRMVVIGGSSLESDGTLASAESFGLLSGCTDFGQDSYWREETSATRGRQAAAAVALGTIILVVGGYCDARAGPVCEVDALDMTSWPAQWRRMPPLHEARSYPAATTAFGAAFVFGGNSRYDV